jgi:hypothetical protein
VEAQLCSQVLLTVWARRSPRSLRAAWRSRSLLHPRGSTVSGSEGPF